MIWRTLQQEQEITALRMIKAVFFDLDETLIDAMNCHSEANAKAFAQYGIDYKEVERRTEIHDFLGQRMNEILKIMRDAMSLSEQEIPLESLMRTRESFFLELVKQKATLLSGAEIAVKQAKQRGKIVAVVSSGTRKYIHLALEKFNLTPYIDFIVGEEDVAKGKPDPDCYEKAYSLLSQLQTIAKEECLVVEDSINGVNAAKAAGLKVCFVPLRQPKEDVDDLQVEYRLSSLAQLAAIQL